MEHSVVRILLVDDSDEFRILVSQMLQEYPRFVVVGQATDGLHAVQLAGALKPQLIVLDVGLPTLNGIEAARQIRRISPDSQILFLTENDSPELAQEALRTGALGYVIKASAGTDLITAAQSVLAGNGFVSSRVATVA